MWLVINWGWTHTYTPTFQETRCMWAAGLQTPGLKKRIAIKRTQGLLYVERKLILKLNFIICTVERKLILKHLLYLFWLHLVYNGWLDSSQNMNGKCLRINFHFIFSMLVWSLTHFHTFWSCFHIFHFGSLVIPLLKIENFLTII